MFGPGKYDAIAKRLREELKADAVVFGVVNGTHGSGFSIEATMEAMQTLPTALRNIADRAEKDVRDGPDAQRMYVILDHPDDYPDKFVVRVWERCGEKFNPTLTHFEAADLEAARKCIPPECVCIGRQAQDDPKITEVWV